VVLPWIALLRMSAAVLALLERAVDVLAGPESSGEPVSAMWERVEDITL
jgi:hypothetical protein